MIIISSYDEYHHHTAQKTQHMVYFLKKGTLGQDTENRKLKRKNLKRKTEDKKLKRKQIKRKTDKQKTKN